MANYFVSHNTKTNSKELYKVVVKGSKFDSRTTRHIAKKMYWDGKEWLVNEKATPTILVYGCLKGFVAKVTDDDIWDILDEQDLTEKEKEKDFKELRAYFDKPNSADVETWHKANETIMTNTLWIPYDTIPQI